MMHVVVVGAGCFGAWTANHLAKAGHAVTLVDAYGPGNSRASSGGETRVIRMGYGAEEIYTRWSQRSSELWTALEERTATPLLHRTGVLWMARDADPLTTATLATLQRVGVAHERVGRNVVVAEKNSDPVEADDAARSCAGTHDVVRHVPRMVVKRPRVRMREDDRLGRILHHVHRSLVPGV